jgi:hypothetical protein
VVVAAAAPAAVAAAGLSRDGTQKIRDAVCGIPDLVDLVDLVNIRAELSG